MNRSAVWAGLLGACGLLASFSASEHKPVAPAKRSRTFVLTSTATVPVAPTGTKAVDFWLPVPHPDANQEVRDLKIESPVPYKIEKGTYGNQMLHFRLAAAPTAPLVVKLTATITRREHLNLSANGTSPTKPSKKEKADPNMARWLAPDRLVPLDAKIKQQAQEVVTKANAKTDLDKARAIYEHVVSTVTYDKTGQGWGRGDIYYACDARRGNCTDFHAIVIGYCRSVGIPARFSIGLPLPTERGKGEIKGYHCWAEFYTTETGWVPVDASEAAKNPDKRNYFFGAHDENRVEFTRGRDLELAPKQTAAPLNYFVYPYAEADGKPLEVTRTYEFADVTKK
nr:transglutaminase domain-containing protein [Hymenobacter jeongseonensis]